ncbi:MAG TPA: leucyl/phenylalanyl-tRNA--protein transferase [Phnomibacter sp.]|nr:leucyl/phenylalanyl-tRNA--protein transferase [Phnomibacter sp.]
MKTLHILDHKLWFPPVEEADYEGLLAAGGDLSFERLLLAYRKGIFPWFEGDVPLWWCPDPRFVLFPEELYVSKSMKQVMKRKHFQFTQNKSFASVIDACGSVHREGQLGTWITPGMREAYIHLHQQGFAHSFEAWHQQKLVGGLYGIKMGKVFFGESMFSVMSNASKAAFIWAVQQLQAVGVQFIDCQVYTAHLESLGARHIDRREFLDLLHNYVDLEN